jgi:PQQ-like domain
VLGTRGSAVWARRGILAVVLIGAAIVPGRASSVTAGRRCTGGHCEQHLGVKRWTRSLPGSWTAQGGALGTVLSQGEAYAAAGGDVAAVGLGAIVSAYRITSGAPLWSAGLAGFRAGSTIVSVRAWPGVVTVGVSIPPADGRTARRREVVLSAATGHRLGSYSAAVYGGAISANEARTVIVGTKTVTSYANATGRVIWRRQTGAVAQAWRVVGDDVFVTIAKGGYLGASPVTALRRIDLRTGAQKILRPDGASFAGALSAVTGGAVLFSGPAGLAAYSQASGRLLWHRVGVVPEAVDAVRQTLYVTSGKALIGLDPATEKVVTSSATPGAAGLYAIRDGVALGLDEGALGDAWGYDLARRKVIWTAKQVPWPHFFVDLSGIGGSADSSGATIVLAECAQVGVSQVSGKAPPCLQPELVAIGPAKSAR